MPGKSFLESPRKLKIVSIVDLAAAELLKHILTEVPPAGTPFTEQEVSNAFNISRSTSRAALIVLAGRNVLVQRPNRAAEIPSFSEKDYQDILLVRRAMDTVTFEILSNDFNKAVAPTKLTTGVRKLRANTQMLTSGNALTPHAVIDNEIALHDGLVSMTNSAALKRSHDSYSSELHLCMLALGKQPDTNIIAEHYAAMLGSIENGDPQAVSLAQEHVAYLESI